MCKHLTKDSIEKQLVRIRSYIDNNALGRTSELLVYLAEKTLASGNCKPNVDNAAQDLYSKSVENIADDYQAKNIVNNRLRQNRHQLKLKLGRYYEKLGKDDVVLITVVDGLGYLQFECRHQPKCEFEGQVEGVENLQPEKHILETLAAINTLEGVNNEIRMLMSLGRRKQAQELGMVLSEILSIYRGNFSWTYISAMLTEAKLRIADGDYGEACVIVRHVMTLIAGIPYNSWTLEYADCVELLGDINIAIFEGKIPSVYFNSESSSLEEAFGGIARSVVIRTVLLWEDTKKKHPDSILIDLAWAKYRQYYSRYATVGLGQDLGQDLSKILVLGVIPELERFGIDVWGFGEKLSIADLIVLLRTALKEKSSYVRTLIESSS